MKSTIFLALAVVAALSGTPLLSTDTTTFNITSFTRTDLSVPEPGALGLFALGLSGALLARRRTAKSRTCA
jgi:PEP-CTERM motif